MKAFGTRLLKFTAFFLAVLTGFVCFVYGVAAPQYGERYTAAIQDKIARLESITEPQIILVGDSNVAFGFYSPLIEEAFGMPVVNLGLHGAFGNSFHERLALFDIREGDIVIVCHDSFADSGKNEDHELTWLTLENHFHLWRLIRPMDVFPMLKAWPKYAVKCTGYRLTGTGNKPTEDLYTKSSFNEWGDVIYPRPDGDHPMNGAQHTGLPGINDLCVNRLNELHAYCRTQGATMLVAAFPIMDDAKAPSPEDFAAFRAELEARLDCPVISDYADYYYDPMYFYDTAYHMTSNGARLRTLQLIEDLRNCGEIAIID